MTTKMSAVPAWRRSIDGLTGERRYSHLPPVEADKRIVQDRAKGIPDAGVPWSYGTLESFLETVAGTNGKAAQERSEEESTLTVDDQIWEARSDKGLSYKVLAKMFQISVYRVRKALEQS